MSSDRPSDPANPRKGKRPSGQKFLTPPPPRPLEEPLTPPTDEFLLPGEAARDPNLPDGFDPYALPGESPTPAAPETLLPPPPAREPSNFRRPNRSDTVGLENTTPRPTPVLPPGLEPATLNPTEVMAGQLDSVPPPEDVASSPPPDAPLVPGYEVLGELGRGGMGVVYKARQVALNRTVALKMVLNAEFADPGELARFLGEAEAIAAVSHPNVIQVYEYGRYRDLPYFAMECVDGGSLSGYLRKEGPLTPDEAAALVGDIASGVQAAHEMGIVHRDLKPGNVLLAGRPHDSRTVSRAGRSGFGPKVVDFGLAKRTGRGEGTRSNAVMGTPAYMAPEQAAGKTKFVGPPADIYALGVILYECLCGRVPFDAEDTIGLILQVVNDEPPPVRKFAPKVPVDLESVCLKCLEKDPKKRYGSAQELVDDLNRYLAREPVTARPMSSVRYAVRWAKKRPVLSGMAVALAASVVGFGGVAAAMWQRAAEQRDRAVASAAAEKEAKEKVEGLVNAARTAEAEAKRQEQLAVARKADAEVNERRALAAEKEARDNIDAVRTARDRAAAEEKKAVAAAAAAEAARQKAVEEEKKARAQEVIAVAAKKTVEEQAASLKSANEQLSAEKAKTEAALVRATTEEKRATAALGRATAEEKKAKAAADAALKALASLTDEALVDFLNTTSKLSRAQEKFLGSVAGQFERLAEAGVGGDDRLGQAATLMKLSRVRARLNQPAEAERAFAEADKLVAAAAEKGDPGAEAARGDLALFRGILAGTQNQPDAAAKELTAAAEVFTKLEPTDPEARAKLGQALDRLGALHATAGRTADAEAALAKAIQIRDGLRGQFPNNPDHAYRAGQSRYQLAVALRDAGRRADAVKLAAEAREIEEKVVEAYPTVEAYRALLADALTLTGLLAADAGDFREAARTYEQTHKQLSELAIDHPLDLGYKQRLAQAKGNVAQSLNVKNEASQNRAVGLYRDALVLDGQLLAASPGAPPLVTLEAQHRHGLAVFLRNQAVAGKKPTELGDVAKLKEAVGECKKAQQAVAGLLAAAPNTPGLKLASAKYLVELGTLHVDLQEYPEAERWLEEAWKAIPDVIAAGPQVTETWEVVRSFARSACDALVFGKKFAEVDVWANRLAAPMSQTGREQLEAARLFARTGYSTHLAVMPAAQRDALVKRYQAGCLTHLKAAVAAGVPAPVLELAVVGEFFLVKDLPEFDRLLPRPPKK